jgi:hypothetical protein
MYLIVAGFTVREDFADVVDNLLHLVDVLVLIPLYYQGGADDLGGGHDV